MTEVKGEHIIADEVIASIVMSTATEVPGLYLSSGGIAERFGKKQPAKGIRIEQQEEGVIVDVKVAADYGVSIPKLCKELQVKVAERVTELTGKNVAAVNVHVTSINMQSTPTEEKEPEESE
ncbi:MAG TPA: Asp23/Gls24 family envelope stress response protein [Clostridia bacterium]|nr:Asp23/Gls24 family envelope stress response protein [Clostridia bacterium]